MVGEAKQLATGKSQSFSEFKKLFSSARERKGSGREWVKKKASAANSSIVSPRRNKSLNKGVPVDCTVVSSGQNKLETNRLKKLQNIRIIEYFIAIKKKTTL